MLPSLLTGATRWAILGNSGSGKTTLARWIARETGAAWIGLDAIAWRSDCCDPVLRPVEEVLAELEPRLAAASWVAEGCYEHVLEALAPHRPLLVWLDLPETVCAERVRHRARDPQEYPGAEAGPLAVEALVNWILAYRERSGPLSRRAHERLFESWPGAKVRLGEGALPEMST